MDTLKFDNDNQYKLFSLQNKELVILSKKLKASELVKNSDHTITVIEKI